MLYENRRTARSALVCLGATLLTVYGQWQRQEHEIGGAAVLHLLAARLIDHTPLLQGLVSRSRDFR